MATRAATNLSCRQHLPARKIPQLHDFKQFFSLFIFLQKSTTVLRHFLVSKVEDFLKSNIVLVLEEMSALFKDTATAVQPRRQEKGKLLHPSGTFFAHLLCEK